MPVYYGWYIVGVAFFANFMSVGTGFYALNAFMEPLCQLRGWTRTDINLALVVGTLFGFSGQFIYGTIVMYTGVRALMIFGSLVGGMAFIFMARVEALWQFYFFYILLFIGNGAYGGIVSATAVNNWFVLKRGKAMGFAAAGISFSGAVLPMIAMITILKSGVDGAALVIGGSVMLMAPLAWFVMREWPEEMGLLPDGATAESGLPSRDKASGTPACNPIKKAGTACDSWPFMRLIRTGAFWKLGLSFAMLMVGTVGVMSQLKPRFTDIGFSSLHAMILMSVTALIGSVGKYSWGSFCDRFKPRRVVVLMSLANAAGLSLALYQNSMTTLILFIVVFGFTMGGIMSTYSVMIAIFFGRECFPSVLRYISIFLILQLAGYLIAGQSHDRTGSYDHAYMIYIGLDLAAAAMLATLKPPRASVVSGNPPE
jgi:MFS transporter, OFA family, oxalate/formate antiporter